MIVNGEHIVEIIITSGTGELLATITDEDVVTKDGVTITLFKGE